MRQRPFLSFIAPLLLTLAGCASAPRAPAPTAAPVVPERYARAFDCSVPAALCADPALAGLHQTLIDSLHAALRRQPLTTRALVMSAHRHWLLGLGTQCRVPPQWPAGQAVDSALRDCVAAQYRAQTERLANWPAAAARDASRIHPAAALREYRTRWASDGAADTCATFARDANALLARDGDVAPEHLPGTQALLGSHGTTRTAVIDGRTVEVLQRDAGLGGGFAQRATGLVAGERTLVDPATLARWIQQLPNAGGRFNTTSSQTNDYAAIDVFRREGRAWVLVAEPLGYYAPAARGEADFAGLYELAGDRLAQRCLYQVDIAAPRSGTLNALPALRALVDALDVATGGPSAGLVPTARQDERAVHDEALWTLLTLPLLGVDDLTRAGLPGALQQRHDALLDALFAWSERNAASKAAYRDVMPRFVPAHDELRAYFAGTHGLSASESARAADLVLFEVFGFAAENLAHDIAIHAPSPTTATSASPRYAVAPAAGDLERGRRIVSLYGALLNAAPDAVVDDFIRYEFAAKPGRARGRTPWGDTALMLAADRPALLARLLAAGADANDTNAWGRTALHAAIEAGNTDSVRLLIKAGARINAATRDWDSTGAGGPDIAASARVGRTPLMNAAALGDVGLIDALFDAPLHDRVRLQRDAAGQDACAVLADNVRLDDAQRKRLAAVLCRAPARTTRERLAYGAQWLDKAIVEAQTRGRTVSGATPDSATPGGRFSMRFDANGNVTGTATQANGETAPLAGSWRVEDDGTLCAMTVLIVEKIGRRIPLPTRCTRFLQHDGVTFAVNRDASIDDSPPALPTDAAQ